MDVGSPRLGVADFGGVTGKVGKVNNAVRSRWAAPSGSGGAGLQPILGNASAMVKSMPASEADKVEKGDVGNVGDFGDAGVVGLCFAGVGGEDKVGNKVDGASVWDEVVRVPAMRLPMRR
jgi:hypothetical protein